ncbi:MAG: trypsin-like peptidase domain-containing protein, partial [Pseudonocardiaceae bacterium]
MLRTEIADRQFRRFVVRIGTPNGDATLGTGVLIAPGWVLTCAHVVAGLDAVRVVPDRGAALNGVAPQWVEARVRARSEARGTSSPSAFWPFPDLALLDLVGWTDHVCAPLTMEEPGRAGEAHAWGFGRREESVAAVGSAASFQYVGVDGDGYLQLKAGDAPPGLSGAPLVCPQRRAIAGMMSVSRDPWNARGGWASPVAALAGGPEVPEDLARLGHQVLALNRDAVWGHRDAWHGALPIPGALALAVDRPWEGAEVDTASAQPSAMLRAEFRVVPYRFRHAELNDVLTWCEGPGRLAVSYLAAAGGAGKTRFAIEVCLAAQARGWLAGLLPKQPRGGDELPLPRLFVIDYVEERDAQVLVERLSALAATATAMAPVRVLLLSRPVGALITGWALEPLKELASGQALNALEAAKDSSSATAELSDPERVRLFEEARQRFGQTWHSSRWVAPGTAEPDLSAGRYGRPLDVLFEAYDAALSGPHWQPGDRPPVDRALDHEIRHWRARINEVDHPLLERCVALVTLAGARDDAEAEALFALVPELAGEPATASRRRLDRWLRGLYEGPDRWNPLRPDRLGEALITRTLWADEGGLALLSTTLDLRSNAQLTQALEVLLHLAADNGTEEIVATALVQRHAALVGRCTEQARGTPQRPGRTGLLDGLARLHTKLLTDHRVATLPTPTQAALSISADALGDLAREHGRSTQAQAIFQGVLVIDERKHELEPGNTTYRRDLSISYNKLADLALAAGRSADAEHLYRQSLQ